MKYHPHLSFPGYGWLEPFSDADMPLIEEEFARDIIAAFDEQNTQIERYKKAAEIYIAERDHANQRYFNAVRLLTGIHALLYPPRFTDHDGRTWQFKSPFAEEQMQELSDRIRALPDEIARAALEEST